MLWKSSGGSAPGVFVQPPAVLFAWIGTGRVCVCGAERVGRYGVGGVWRTGQVVDGRYEVVEVHEDGGMGLVYRVRHLAWGTDLAVKSPRPELFRTAADQDRFTAEAEIWVSLGLHPNVCGCHYVRVLDGLPRVFAEYVTGGSLRDWIGDRRLYAGGRTTALGRILDVAVQCARGCSTRTTRASFIRMSSPPTYCWMSVRTISLRR